MKNSFLITALFVSCAATGQDYFIKYDLVNEKTEYYKISARKYDTVKINAVNIKADSKLTIQVDNFNPFYWDARVQTLKKKSDQNDFRGIFNPFAFYPRV